MGRYSILSALLLLFCLGTALAQDEGVPDTVSLHADSLFTGRSAPIQISVTNDFPLKTLSFGLLIAAIDSGFAKYDSIVWTGRMADPNILSFRNFGAREVNGISPDTIAVTAFIAGDELTALPAGSSSIAEVWMTGLSPGQMRMDSTILPPGGLFVMVPFKGDFQEAPFTPRFEATSILVVEGVGQICGNIDGSPDGSVNIADLTALIDFLFINFTVPPGLHLANVDGSPNGSVDISDLTLLIDHLFINFTSMSCI